MKAVILFAALCLGAVSAQVTIGSCVLRGTAGDSGIYGTVTFELSGRNVTVTADIHNITANANALHGMHVHQYGDLSDTSSAATSVGSHFSSPSLTAHNCPETGQPRHLGDMGNWNVSGGSISMSKSMDLLALTGNLSIIGRAVVLHNLTDDCATVASSGGRLAFCVIGIANPGSHGYNATTTNDAHSDYTPAPTQAACDLVPIGSSGVSGRFFFQQATPGGPTVVTGMVNGITGRKGVHIHTFGELSTTGTASSGHYNPNGAPHSLPPNTPRHVGDMGNIFYYNNSVAYYEYSNDLVSLTGSQNVIGRTVVVHGQEDVCDPNNLGPRVAQCVIGIAASGTTPVVTPLGTDTSQSDAACFPATTATDTSTDSSAFAVAPAAVLLVLSVLAALF